MTQPISTAPEQINIIYRQHKTTGLLAAISPDLDGLIVFGRTPEHLCQKLPLAVTELVKAQTGQDLAYDWAKEDDGEDDGGKMALPPGFISVSEELGRLVPA